MAKPIRILRATEAQLSDSSVVASTVGPVILIVDSNSTKPVSLSSTIENLQVARASIIGVIINKVKRSRIGGYYYYRYNYYSSYTSGTKSTRSNDKGLASRILGKLSFRNR